MLYHINLGASMEERQKKLRSLITTAKIAFAGYEALKVYGTLSCPSGKRLKMETRVFFETEKEALEAGYRPCPHCMPEK